MNAERWTLRVLQLGAIAVVLAATTHRAFDLDRFLVPKELVLHVVAVIAGLLSIRRITITRVDLLLAAFIALSIASALFATNPWLAMRALAVSASGVLLFLAARTVPRQPLINALALAVVLASVSSLLQAYGIWIDLFSHNRAPGGTLGNRNFVAHCAAFGFPVVVFAALRSRVAMLGIPIVVASLVLTRSRAAWLAFAAMAAVLLVVLIREHWKRLAMIIALAGAGVIAALLIPNTLNWRSDNPYLDSVRDVANYQEGSGRGRLIQYERSLRMAAHHPILGVGPGNWPVMYPKHAPASDPSMDTSEAGVTFNPWPSSDWVAFASERGFLAALLLIVAFALLALKKETLPVVVAAAVVGTFDAVLLLGLPTYLIWTSLGALLSVEPAPSPARGGAPAPARAAAGAAPGATLRTGIAIMLLAIALLGAVRSTSQIIAMEIFAATGNRGRLETASRIDPGNYRIHLRLARGGRRDSRCAHARAAHALFPSANAAKSAARGCD